MAKSSTLVVHSTAVNILEKPVEVLSISAAAVGKAVDEVDLWKKLKRFDLLELFGANDGKFSKLVARFSDLSKLIRVMAYILWPTSAWGRLLRWTRRSQPKSKMMSGLY